MKYFGDPVKQRYEVSPAKNKNGVFTASSCTLTDQVLECVAQMKADARIRRRGMGQM